MSNAFEMMKGKLNLSENGEMSMDFRRFLHKNGISADELEEAYYRHMGTSDRTDGEKIEMARREIVTMVSRGFPVNHFVDIIQSRRRQE